MEFSCHTWAFHDLTLTEALGTIARLGFRHADIGTGPGFPLRGAVGAPARTAAEIKQDLLVFDLKISDLYLMLPRISMGENEADSERRGKDLELFKALMPFAKALNPPGITVSPGVSQTDDGAYDRTVDALKQMVEAAQAVDLTVSIEPHLESMASTPDAAIRLIHDVPGLKITLDWAQMVTQNIAHDDILPLLPYTRHVQIRQAARGHLQTLFDKGKVEIPRVVNDLAAFGYTGVVCVELMNIPGKHGMSKVDALRETVKMRDALRDARAAIPPDLKPLVIPMRPPPAKPAPPEKPPTAKASTEKSPPEKPPAKRTTREKKGKK